MQATVETADDTALVRLTGRLTFAENGAFRHLLDRIGQSGSRRVVFDLGGLDAIDSAGMGMLLVARDHVAAKGGRVVLRHAGGTVGRVLDLARFAALFDAPARYAQV